MTDGLMECPFCGGEAGWMDGLIVCSGCGVSMRSVVQSYELTNKRWNTRYKRTCEWSIKKGGTFYDVYQCSACGYEYAESRTDHGIKVELIDAKFCPNCGAEVVDGD